MAHPLVNSSYMYDVTNGEIDTVLKSLKAGAVRYGEIKASLFKLIPHALPNHFCN